MAEQYVEQFKSNLRKMVTVLYRYLEQANYGGVSGMLETVFETELEKPNLINRFIEKTYRDWDQLRQHQIEPLFENLGHLLPNFGDILVLSCKSIWQDLEERKRKVLWAYIHSYVTISIKYIHVSRQPIYGDQIVYQKQFYPEIDLLQPGGLCQQWEIDLLALNPARLI